MKRLYRSDKNKVIAGVMGGIGEYANVDPVVIRAFYLAITIFSAVFPGIIVYLLLILVIPKHPNFKEAHAEEVNNANQ